MYKKDKQGIVIVLVVLTVLLASAIAFKWQGTIVASAIGLTVAIVHILSEIHTRLRQLEYDAPSYFAQSATIGAQKIVIYSAALVALFAYANTWMWLAGGALLVLLLCLIQTISSFQTRLLHLEQYGKTVVQNDLNSVSAHINQANQLSTPNHSVSESQVQHPATWMQAESSSSNEYSLTQPSQKQLSTSSQTAWWQPILQWMIHGNRFYELLSLY